MRGRHHHPAMLRLLERKRAEKLALDRVHEFGLKVGRHRPRDRHGADQEEPSGKPFLFGPPPMLPPKPPIVPPRTSRLTLPETMTVRGAGLYAVLQAEEELVARKKAKGRRRKAVAIDAKRLKMAVERVRKPERVNQPASSTGLPHDLATAHPRGSRHSPGPEIGPDGSA